MAVPKVVVTLLNLNEAHHTVPCIQSVQQCTYPNFEILVVDNSSSDRSCEIIETTFPSVRIIRNTRNLGYTGGVNVSIREAQALDPCYILVLNNDTLVHPRFLDYMVDAMEKNPNAAAACGTIYYHPDTRRIWYAGGHMVPWRGLAVHDHYGEYLPPESLDGVHRVDFITGCLILFRNSHLPMTGMEDERFFIYLDDIELSARIIRRGFDLLYVSKAIIYHKVAGEGESPFKLYYGVRNRMLTIVLCFRGIQRFIALTYFSAVISCKIVYWAFTKPIFFKAATYGMSDFFRGDLHEGRGVAEFRTTK